MRRRDKSFVEGRERRKDYSDMSDERPDLQELRLASALPRLRQGLQHRHGDDRCPALSEAAIC
jgi:hypothetical protein